MVSINLNSYFSSPKEIQGTSYKKTQTMISVASVDNVTLFCPRDGAFSFFNSPYPAHKNNTGIDIYPNKRFMEIAPSPVNGMIKEIRKVRAPIGRGFKDAGYDVVTIIDSTDNQGKVVKILHLDPLLEVGDSITSGDDLGKLLRSGYFGWGTSPHIHLEVRNQEDPIRVRGGLPLKIHLDPSKGKPLQDLEGEVIDVVPEYVLMRLNNRYNGLTVELNGTVGILDGGIPHYKWVGVHTDIPSKGFVKLLDKKIAAVTKQGNKHVIADCLDFGFIIEDKPIIGLSLYITPVEPPIVKILPKRLEKLRLKIGDEVEVSVKINEH
jgi:hypothetical protein